MCRVQKGNKCLSRGTDVAEKSADTLCIDCISTETLENMSLANLHRVFNMESSYKVSYRSQRSLVRLLYKRIIELAFEEDDFHNDISEIKFQGGVNMMTVVDLCRRKTIAYEFFLPAIPEADLHKIMAQASEDGFWGRFICRDSGAFFSCSLLNEC